MMELQPGDLLLYPPTSLMGWLIAWKTWSRPPISHVEVYLGNGQSAAARGDGVIRAGLPRGGRRGTDVDLAGDQGLAGRGPGEDVIELQVHVSDSVP